jgi:hypothetical protein
VEHYCFQVAHRYIPRGVVAYEIGNEVNLPHPGVPTPDGAQYVRDLFTPCSTGVREAARMLGVPVTIILGSLAPTDATGGAEPLAFLGDVYAAGVARSFDAVAWHPYGGGPPLQNPHMVGDPEALHALMASMGDGAKQIWATEVGYPTGGAASVTEDEQAELAREALTAWHAKPFAGPLFWYSIRDRSTQGTDREDFFGLLRHDGSRKPAYDVVAGLFTR